ncbi:MAG TPA: glycine cleavage T C-terminal barrel domain-containing protein [Thermoleophilaceae bacterium]|nr:glycine cleavage T C-terminal barrel domain-containing protein [Thermoleophilaceae bacterium]
MIATSDYELLVESSGLVDLSDRTKLVLRGAETVDFLQGQVTNDVEALSPRSGCYAAILNHKGKLRTDLRILRGEDWIWLDCDPLGDAVLRHTVETYSLGRDVAVEDLASERSILALVGPGADAALDPAPPAEEHAFVEGEHGIYVRTALGVDVITPDAGAVRAVLGVPEVSEDAVECLRVEIGRPRLGLDMDGDTIPQEAGINERAVSFTKGCYVGQETVARLHYKGKPNRHLRGLRLSGPASRGDEVVLGEKTVGRVGSACESPRLGPIALALVRREAAPGDEVLVAGTPATVVELPFAGD